MARPALEAMNSLLRALLPSSIPKLLKSAATRGLVVQQVLFWREKGVHLSDLASFLNTSPRQLARWIDRLEDWRVKTLMERTCVDLGENGRDHEFGAGLIDALAAVESARAAR